MTHFLKDVTGDTKPILPFTSKSKPCETINEETNDEEDTSMETSEIEITQTNDTTISETTVTKIEKPNELLSKSLSSRLAVPKLFNRRQTLSNVMPKLHYGNKQCPSESINQGTLSTSYGSLITNLEKVNSKLQCELKLTNEKLNEKTEELKQANESLVTVKQLAYSALEKAKLFQDQFSELQSLKLQQGKKQAHLVEESARFRAKLKNLGVVMNDLNGKLENQRQLRSANQVKLKKQELIIKNLEKTIDELSGNLSEEKLTVSSLQSKLAQNTENEVKKILENVYSKIFEIFNKSNEELGDKFNEFGERFQSETVEKYQDSNKSIASELRKQFQTQEKKLNQAIQFIKQNGNKELSVLLEKLATVSFDISKIQEAGKSQNTTLTDITKALIKLSNAAFDFNKLRKEHNEVVIDLETRNVKLQQAIDRLIELQDKDQETLQAMKKSEKQHLNELTLLKTQLNSQTSKLVETEKENTKLVGLVDKFRLEKESIKKQFDQQKKSLQQSEKANKKLLAANNTLSKDNEKLSKTSREQIEKMNEMERSNCDLVKELEQTKENMEQSLLKSEFETKENKLIVEIKDLKKSLASIEKKLSNTLTENNELQLEIDKSKKQIENSRNNLTEKETQIDKLNKVLSEREKSIIELKENKAITETVNPEKKANLEKVEESRGNPTSKTARNKQIKAVKQPTEEFNNLLNLNETPKKRLTTKKSVPEPLKELDVYSFDNIVDFPPAKKYKLK